MLEFIDLLLEIGFICKDITNYNFRSSSYKQQYYQLIHNNDICEIVIEDVIEPFIEPFIKFKYRPYINDVPKYSWILISNESELNKEMKGIRHWFKDILRDKNIDKLFNNG